MNAAQICTSDQRPSIDKAKNRYVGASALGIGDTVLSPNILDLRVWDGYTNRTDLKADCILNPGTRSDGWKFAYCPTGTQMIGALVHCLSPITSVSLEELIDGNWTSVGPGRARNESWAAGIGTPCDPNSGDTSLPLAR
jgi:hypothetical protein